MNMGPVSKQKIDALDARMAELGIDQSKIIEKFILGSGPGGQKLNKTASCVFISYPPEEINIKCQRTRSRALNRYYARWELCERIAEKTEGEKSRRQQEAEKIRRQKRRRSRRQRAIMLADKRKHSEKKAMRKPPEVTE
jgi:protein subunit release factor B